MNKYQKWYNSLIERGKLRPKAPGLESHHILPSCLSGPDTLENKTNLTTREHFICHWLLTKIYTTGKERYLILNALQGMRRENKHQQRYHTKITSRVYANLKEEWSKLSSERMKGENNPMYGIPRTKEMNNAVSEANKGRKQTAGEKERQIAAQKGKKRKSFSEEWKENLAKSHKSKQEGFNGAHSDSTKQLMRQKAIGRKQSAETIAKKANAIRGSKREKKLCPHCQQEVAVNGYARWHGNNCKHNKGK